MPAVGNIHFDTEDRLWIQEYIPPFEERVPKWWILGDDGHFLATANVPLDFIYHIRPDLIVGVNTDTVGVSYVQIHPLIHE
jgi:hypothetical protein